jgi:NADP-dependent 3-hydroxy acid dehydrogenase YdfG
LVQQRHSLSIAPELGLVLLGWTRSALENIASLITEEGSVMEMRAFNVTQEKAVEQVALQVGRWDLLVLGVCDVSVPSLTASAVLSDWWQSFEIR